MTRLTHTDCFALTAESIIDEAVKLRYVGGTYANTRPTEFLCLVLKLLQIQPDKEIIMEYLRAEEFKCVGPRPRLTLADTYEHWRYSTYE